MDGIVSRLPGDDSLFVNRRLILDELLNGLSRPSMKCYALVGPRKIGKTALLQAVASPTIWSQLKLEQKLKNRVFCAIECIPFEGCETIASFYLALYENLVASLPAHLQALLPPADEAPERAFSAALKALVTGGVYVVLLFDEFEALVNNPVLLHGNLFHALRSQLGEPYVKGRFAWVTSTRTELAQTFRRAFDRHNIPERIRQSASQFFAVTDSVPVGLFSRRESDLLVEALGAEHGLTLTEQERQTIHSLGGRFPAFLQQAFAFVARARQYDDISFDEMLQRCERDLQRNWRERWSKLSSRQRDTLFAVALGDTGPSAEIHLAALHEQALMYSEDGQQRPFSERFGAFVRTLYRPSSVQVKQRVGPNGQYEVLEIAGRTGHSQVARCYDHILGREVAIKFFLVDLAASGHAMDDLHPQLLREAQILANCDQDRIGRVFGILQAPDPPGVIMEWIHGQSLELWTLGDEPRPVHKVVELGAQLAETLASLHASEPQIIHRDIKPNNIIVHPGKGPVLIDFDIARWRSHHSIATPQEGAMRYVGTPGYSAPEQFGSESTPVGPPADVFALAVVLYELLTHEVPFPLPQGTDPREYPNGRLPPVEPRSVPEPIFARIAVALSQEPAARPSAAELAKLLRSYR